MKLSADYLKAKRAAEAAMPVKDEAKVQDEHPATHPMKILKSVTIEASFPELKTGRMYQTGRGRGSNFKAAAANAMRDLLKQQGLKAQRFTLCKATISFGTVQVEE